MESRESAVAVQKSDAGADVDILIVGAGILGLYQLYRARQDGFSVELFEAGDGLGGTWFWNRYPGARFDSESYTYAFLFSKELFEEWEWHEHFAGQPEIESYLNYAVDKFDLRKHIRFGTRVTSAVWDETAGLWRCGPPTARKPAPGSWWRHWGSCHCRSFPRCRAGPSSGARRTTRGCGRRTR